MATEQRESYYRALEAERLENGLILACTSAVITGRVAWRYQAVVPWTNSAAATPLHDIATVTASYPRDQREPSPFDRFALVYLNRGTLNHLLRTTNRADVYGKRVSGSAMEDEDAANHILRAMALPQLAVYDRAYLSLSGQRSLDLFIPDGVALMIDKTFTHIAKMVVS